MKATQHLNILFLILIWLPKLFAQEPRVNRCDELSEKVNVLSEKQSKDATYLAVSEAQALPLFGELVVKPSETARLTYAFLELPYEKQIETLPEHLIQIAQLANMECVLPLYKLMYGLTYSSKNFSQDAMVKMRDTIKDHLVARSKERLTLLQAVFYLGVFQLELEQGIFQWNAKKIKALAAFKKKVRAREKELSHISNTLGGHEDPHQWSKPLRMKHLKLMKDEVALVDDISKKLQADLSEITVLGKINK